jgi:hypothetical protein
MLLLGQFEHGAYVDEHTRIHSGVLNEYYGVEGQARPRQTGQTGTGHPVDEDEDDIEDDISMDEDDFVVDEYEAARDGDLEDWIAQDHEHNFNHEVVIRHVYVYACTFAISIQLASRQGRTCGNT